MSSNGRLKFYADEARDAFKTAGEVWRWTILHDERIIKEILLNSTKTVSLYIKSIKKFSLMKIMPRDVIIT